MATEKAMADTPKVLVAGPFTYEVVFDSEVAYSHGYLGLTSFRSRRIKLEPLQADTDLPQTVMHEALHALGGAFEIKEWEEHKRDADGNHTDKIDLMASALLQFIRGNPDLVAWLQKSK